MKKTDTIKIVLPEEIKHAASVSPSPAHASSPSASEASEVKIDHLPMLLQAQTLLQRHRQSFLSTPSQSVLSPKSFPKK